jgi:hypothetical protein
MQEPKRISIQRDLLLIEIDRRCCFPDCGARVFIGLTKQEACGYTGFECDSCQRWNDDNLSEKDVPDWWNEVKLNTSRL